MGVERVDALGRPKRIQSEAGIDIRLELVGYVAFPAGHRGIIHGHPFWELVYIGGGRGSLKRAGGIQPCARGDLLLLQPGEKHQFLAAESPLEQLYLGFSFRPADAAGPDRRRLPSSHPQLELIRDDLAECHDRLKAGGRANLPEVRVRLMPAVGRISGLLAAAPGNPEVSQDPVRLSRDFLRSDLRNPVSVARLARRLCLSPKHLGEIFKRGTGMSLKEFHNDLRLARARELLLGTDRPVSAIAGEVGLANPAYFARLFQRKFRTSARDLRRSAVNVR